MNTHIRLPLRAALAAAFVLHSFPAAGSPQSATGPNTRVDTRDLALGVLSIQGPATIAQQHSATYSAWLDGENVTARCDWPMPKCSRSFAGWWQYPSISASGILQAGATEPGDVIEIRARMAGPTGSTREAVKNVQVVTGAGLYFGIDQSVSYIGPVGQNFEWQVTAGVSGTAAGQSGVTFTWYRNGNLAGTGKTRQWDHTGRPSVETLRVVASDTQGNSAEQSVSVIYRAPAPGEPGQRFDAMRKLNRFIVDKNGNVTVPDPNLANNGLIVLTHGIWSSPFAPWLGELAAAIEDRLQGPGRPNVVIFGWQEEANPKQLYATAPERLATVASSVGLSASALRAVFPGTTAHTDFLFDVLMIRETAKNVGRASDGLAGWLKQEAAAGTVSKTAPIHLIGHSAGGFVMGECNRALRMDGFNIRRVTMLDTPVAQRIHFEVGNGAVIERYVSSLYGRMCPDLDRISFQSLTGLNIVDKLDSTWYHRTSVGGWNSWSPIGLNDAHGYSHEWYESTVGPYPEAEGFQLSPFITGGAQGMPPAGDSPGGDDPGPPQESPPVPQDAPLPPLPLEGFTTFGAVTGTGAPFVLTEASNAGIVKAMTLPHNAAGLRFRYQFTTPGDGDFVVVYFGDSVPLFVASPSSSNTTAADTAEISLTPFAGQTGELVIKLVAQDQPNAVVTLEAIELTRDDDIDSDSLLAADELAYGTDPRFADTDGDGLDDAYELNTTLTDPLRADTDGDGINDGAELIAGTDPEDALSRFAIRSVRWEAGGFRLAWSAVAGKSYRVVRSDTPGFGDSDVVASGIPAVVPETTRTDTTANPSVTPRMFYRVEVE
ncbi:MAG: hypothetical protein MUF04_06845 [Akkermansiaceae bacterium]|nr:hypothetical protein [Akkermansiaceae bacterium]